MSSVASKHALLIALGGFSIAALFVWFVKKDKSSRDKKKRLEDVVANGTATKSTDNGVKQQNGHAGGAKSSKQPARKEAEEETVATQNEKPSNESSKKQKKRQSVPTKEAAVALPAEQKDHTDCNASGDGGVVKHNEAPKEKEIKVLPSDQKPQEIEIGKKSKVNDPKEVEEECVKKEEVKLKSVPVPHIEMPSKKKVLEHEQIPEEPTPTKILDTPLSLDITAQMSPAAFSWSEEMENSPCRSYNEEEYRVHESSDIERSPASPLRQVPKKSNQRSVRKGRGGKDHYSQEKYHYDKHAPVKKVQRRLTKEKSVEEPQAQPRKEESMKQKRVVLNHHEFGDSTRHQPMEPQHIEEDYAKSDSPGLDSQNSEASSQDSGRATIGLASSLSPLDEGLTGTDDDFLPMYEFEIPNSLVGLVIGVKGKTIKELSTRTNVRMLIRQHHATEKVKTHQICQVRGKRDEINHCLQMLRRRFPSPRFPELNLQPVVPPIMPSSNFDMLSTQPTWLTLPEEIKCEIAVSSIVSPAHFFIQQPTHPSFASLRHLDMYMGSLYGDHSNLPELPIPCQDGLLCAAPVANSWFRAVTVQYFEDTDEVFVKFVDYGGYSKMARQDLRQIRTDLMSLPFQSTEVMLAHVRPADGSNTWGEESFAQFRQLCTGQVISSKVVGYSADTRIPMVELYVTVKGKNGEAQETRFDQLLMDLGQAITADPSKMVRPTAPAPLIGAAPMKRPSLASQTSQTTVVC